MNNPTKQILALVALGILVGYIDHKIKEQRDIKQAERIAEAIQALYKKENRHSGFWRKAYYFFNGGI